MKSYFEISLMEDIRIYYLTGDMFKFNPTITRFSNSKNIKNKLELYPKYSGVRKTVEFRIKTKNYLLYTIDEYFGEIYNFIIYSYYNDDLLIFREHVNSCSFNNVCLYLYFSEYFKIKSCTINRESLKL